MTKKKLKKYCKEVFGTKAKAKAWLNTPNFYLDLKAPKKCIKNKKTRLIVYAMLVRIEHGIFC